MKYVKSSRRRYRRGGKRKVSKMVSKRKRMGRLMKPSWFPFGKSRTCKLRYAESININPGAGVAGQYIFSCNSLYDPNVSGTGHQPYGFDQLMALYNHYTVTGARCRVTMIGTDNLVYTLGIKLSDSSSLSSTVPDSLLEQPGFKKKIVSYANAIGRNYITCNFSCKKFFRHPSKNFILSDDTLSGTSSTNPVEQAYFIIVLAPAIALQDLANCTLQVEIDYVATFTGPKELLAS